MTLKDIVVDIFKGEINMFVTLENKINKKRIARCIPVGSNYKFFFNIWLKEIA